VTPELRLFGLGKDLSKPPCMHIRIIKEKKMLVGIIRKLTETK
jgi:hypothetical protein